MQTSPLHNSLATAQDIPGGKEIGKIEEQSHKIDLALTNLLSAIEEAEKKFDYVCCPELKGASGGTPLDPPASNSGLWENLRAVESTIIQLTNRISNLTERSEL